MKDKLFTAAMLLALLSSAAGATAELELINGASTVTVMDNGPGDTNPADGIIAFEGTVGDFVTNVTTGSTKPAMGSASDPQLHLNSLNILNSTPSTAVLTILFSDTGFGPLSGMSNASVAITDLSPGGSLSTANYTDASNVIFGMATLLVAQGPFTAPTSAGPVPGAPISDSSPFSLTQSVSITLPADGDFIGSADLNVVPEVNGVFSAGLVAIALALQFARRRRQAKASR